MERSRGGVVETLVCVPGLMCTTGVFDALRAAIPGQSRVFALLPLDDFEAIATRLADSLTAPSILCGMSMGAYLALAAARLAPERIAGLVLIGGAAGADSPQAAQNRLKAVDWAKRKGADALASVQAQSMLAEANRGRGDLRAVLLTMTREIGLDVFAAHQLALAGRPDQTDALAGISCPALVLTGAEDAVNPPAIAREMASAMPHASFLAIEGCGHLPVLEAPEIVAAHIRQFIESNFREARSA